MGDPTGVDSTLPGLTTDAKELRQWLDRMLFTTLKKFYLAFIGALKLSQTVVTHGRAIFTTVTVKFVVKGQCGWFIASSGQSKKDQFRIISSLTTFAAIAPAATSLTWNW